MAHFDIISAASKAYQTSWASRAYLLRLAVVPILMKFACFTLAASFAGGDDASYLRFMLIMVPALLAEGWMLSHYIRFLMLGHVWPFRPTGNLDADLAVLSVRARGVLSGMIVFVLINMALGLMMAAVSQYMMPYMPADGAVEGATVPAHVALLSFLMLGFLFWGFRLMWLYVPYALNIDGLTYLSKLKGVSTSFSMIGVWILCLVPFFLALRLSAGLLAQPLSMTFGEGVSSFVIMMLTVVIDTFKSIVATAGITFGIQQMFGFKQQQGENS